MVDASFEPKHLAANDKRTRDSALEALRIHLQTGAELEEADTAHDWDEKLVLDARWSQAAVLRMWKGIFFAMWMSDKPLVQQELCMRLADLVLEIRPEQAGRPARVEAALAFLKGFWTTMTREWGGIDRYRADKYYALIRRYLTTSFRLLLREHWDEQAIRKHTEVLIGPGGPLNVRDPKAPFGILSHVVEIYLSCLCAAITEEEPSSPAPVPLLSLLGPLAHALCYSPSKQIYAAVQSHGIMPLIDACDGALESHGTAAPPTKKRKLVNVATAADPLLPLLSASILDEQGEAQQGAAQVKRTVLQYLFNEAAKQETPDANRHRLYALFREHEHEE